VLIVRVVASVQLFALYGTDLLVANYFRQLCLTLNPSNRFRLSQISLRVAPSAGHSGPLWHRVCLSGSAIMVLFLGGNGLGVLSLRIADRNRWCPAGIAWRNLLRFHFNGFFVLPVMKLLPPSL